MPRYAVTLINAPSNTVFSTSPQIGWQFLYASALLYLKITNLISLESLFHILATSYDKSPFLLSFSRYFGPSFYHCWLTNAISTSDANGWRVRFVKGVAILDIRTSQKKLEIICVYNFVYRATKKEQFKDSLFFPENWRFDDWFNQQSCCSEINHVPSLWHLDFWVSP